MPLTRKSTRAVLLGFFLPAADHVVVQAKVACRLSDAQTTLSDQAHRLMFELAAVLFAFGCFVLNSHDCSCVSVSLIRLSTLDGELQFRLLLRHLNISTDFEP